MEAAKGCRVEIVDYKEKDFNLNGYTGSIVDTKEVDGETLYEVWIEDCIEPDWLHGWRFKVIDMQHYWITPVNSKKNHIAGQDGMALCNSWAMSDKTNPVRKGDASQEDDCKKCVKAYNKEKIDEWKIKENT